jgi:hypothetical protein
LRREEFGVTADERDNLEELPVEDLSSEQDGDTVEHLITDLESDDPTEDPDDPATDPAMQAVEEAGGGVSEGFELSEHDLIENAEGERDDDPLRNPFNRKHNSEDHEPNAEYGESDHVIEADEE